MRKQEKRKGTPALHPDAAAIYRQVLLGFAGSRTRGFHFPGYFLNIDWPLIADDGVEGTLTTGPHCCNADGSLNLAAFGVFLDTSVAVTSRLKLAAGSHQATVHLHAQFTGRPLRGSLSVAARHEGHSSGSTVRQAIMRSTVFANGEVVCHATSAFIHLPPPPGLTAGPPVRSRARVGDLKPLAVEDLDHGERRVLTACDEALRRADSRRSFIEHFWNVVPRPWRGGARCDVSLGAQFGNRTGDVQGGVLFGIAAATAQAAAPRHPQISNISAWYISPGRGDRLVVRSRLIHAGRSFAVVRTGISRPDGARVLETVSQHAAW